MSALTLASTLVMACSCVIGKADDKAPQAPAPSPEVRTAEIATKWQDVLITRLNESKTATEAFGVFSEGGWSNSGQVMILLDAGRRSGRLLVVPPNKAALAVDRDMTKAELDGIVPALATMQTLDDVDITSFDGLVFEMLQATRANGAPAKATRRILLRNPGAKPTPEHDAVVAAFQQLRRS